LTQTILVLSCSCSLRTQQFGAPCPCPSHSPGLHTVLGGCVTQAWVRPTGLLLVIPFSSGDSALGSSCAVIRPSAHISPTSFYLIPGFWCIYLVAHAPPWPSLFWLCNTQHRAVGTTSISIQLFPYVACFVCNKGHSDALRWSLSAPPLTCFPPPLRPCRCVNDSTLTILPRPLAILFTGVAPAL